MNKKLGVLLIHGVGNFADDFANDIIEELRERVSARGLNRDDIAWESVHWAPVLAAQETRIWDELSADHDLNWAKLRKFFINVFGNLTAYQSSLDRPEGAYHKIHDLVAQSLRKLRSKLGGEDRPLVIVAHSLGSVIMSNYIWDRQKGREQERYGGTAFERMETLAGLATLGSNIPLFTLACNTVTSIEFPTPGLPERLRKKAKWLNLYDSDDVLAWPLKPLSLSYKEAVTEDMEVSVGNILTAWNPANHAAYWTEPAVIKPLAYLISSILDVCDATNAEAAPHARERAHDARGREPHRELPSA